MIRRLVSRGLITLVVAAMSVSYGTSARAGLLVDLDFSRGDDLATIAAQGLVFRTSSGVMESEVSRVENGTLIMDTMWSNARDIYAWYELVPGYFADRDTELEVVVRATDTSRGFGFNVGISGETESAALFINPDLWFFFGGSSGTYAGGVAKFTLSTSANSDAYVLKVNDVVVRTGRLNAGNPGTPVMYFGDGTPTGGNMRAEITSIRYSAVALSDPQAVPEPSNLAAALASVLCLSVGFGLRRRSRRQALVRGTG